MTTATKKRPAKAAGKAKSTRQKIGSGFTKAAAEANREHAIRFLRNRTLAELRDDDLLVMHVARKAGIKLSNDVYSREMLMAWPKGELIKLGQASGIELPAVRDRTVGAMVDALLANKEKLIVPDALKL